MGQYQRQHQQSSSSSSSSNSGGTGSKTPLLVLGAAALMIQGLYVLPTTANAETINTVNTVNDKVSFDLGVHHNLQTIASLSTGGSGPAGAGPQLWGTTSSASSEVISITHSSNDATTTHANLHQEQKGAEEEQQQQKDALFENAPAGLYRKIRLEETSDAPVDAVDSTFTTIATTVAVADITAKNMAGEVDEADDIQSEATEPAVDDDDLEKEVAAAEKESVGRNTRDTSSSSDAPNAKKDDKKDDVTSVAVVEEESLSVIVNPVSLSAPSSDTNGDDKKKDKKTASTVVEETKTTRKDDDGEEGGDEDVQSDKTTDADEAKTETDGNSTADVKAEADAETPRVGDQVVLDKDGNLVRDVTLESEVETRAEVKEDNDAYLSEKHETSTSATENTSSDSTTTSDDKKPLKTTEEEEQEDEEDEEEEETGSGVTGDKANKGEKGDMDKEDNYNDQDDKEITEGEEVKKDETTTATKEIPNYDGGKNKKKTSHHEQAFAGLREQLLKQHELQLQQQVVTTEALAELDQVSAPIVDDGATTLARSTDFVPPEDMQAVMNAQAVKDKKENKKTSSPLTPQQIADTEHQGASAFFELFAADVFPDVKLVGNNELQDLDFEQRLNKQKEDKKVKALKKKKQQQQQQQQEMKNKKKVASDKKGIKKKQQNRHQNEKRALPDVAAAAAPEMTENERVHAVLENIFGKEGAAKVEAEAETGDSADVKITAQGNGKDIFGTLADPDADADADADEDEDKDADGEDANITNFDQDLDDEPIGILGVGKKGHHNKKHHHHKHHAAENDVTTIFTTGGDAKDTKDTKNDKSNHIDLPPMMKPSNGGPSDRTAPGPSAGQPQQHQQSQQPASPPAGAPPAGAKGGPATPSKDQSKNSAGTAGFGTVPMFGPAQLDLGNSAASLIASRGSMALALVFGVAWMVL